MDWTLEYNFLNNCEFCIMVDKLVSDIRKALDNDLYLSHEQNCISLMDLQLKNKSRDLNYDVIIERTGEGILCRDN